MGREIARGAAWMVLFRTVDRAIGLVSTAILARLLVPADFGLIAMAMSIIAIVELATAFGFDVVLIQKSQPTREHFDTAWTLNLITGVACALLIAAAAMPVSQFYGDSRLAPLMWAFAAAWAFHGLENTGTANFRRDMNFAAEFRFMFARRVISFLATMLAAWLLRSYWALVIGTMVGRWAGIALSYAMHSYRPRLCLSKARELFRFSGWLIFNNFMNVSLNKLPHVYVGKAFGAQAVGSYSVGAEIAALAQTELVAPINRAVFPGYAKLARDVEAFKRACLDATSFIMLVTLPVCVGIAVLAGPFVRALLGSQWGAAVPLIQVLALSGAIRALTANNTSAYLALGRPHLATSILGARLVALVLPIPFLVPRYGIEGVAMAEVISSFIGMVISLPLLLRILRIRVSEYTAGFWRPLIGSLIMGLTVHVAVDPVFDADHATDAMRVLLLGALLGAATYIGCVGLMWWLLGRPAGAEAHLVKLLAEKVRAKKGGGAAT